MKTVRWATPAPNRGYEVRVDGIWIPASHAEVLKWRKEGLVYYNPVYRG